MKTGRPPASLLDPDDLGPLRHAVVIIGTQRRLTLKAWVRHGLSWMEAEPATALLAFPEPGIANMLDWEAEAEAVLVRRRELIRDGSADALETLRALEDRYHRVEVDREGRLALPEIALVHFDLAPGSTHRLAAVRYPSHIRLMSPTKRNALNVDDGERFADLP